jgi:hypothetical protein
VVELMAYGLTGLMAILVIAFCFAWGDELPWPGKQSSRDLINNARLDHSRIIESTTRSLRFGRPVGDQQETGPASSPRKTSPVEAVPSAIRNDSSRNARGPRKAFNG